MEYISYFTKIQKCAPRKGGVFMEENNKMLPVVAMRGLVMFPKMVLQFDIGREKSIKAIKKAMSEDRKLLLIAQKDIEVSNPKTEDLFNVGVIATIKQIITTDDGTKRVVVEGEHRIKVTELVEDPYLQASYIEYPTESYNPEDEELKASVRVVQELFEEYCVLSPRMPKELVFKVITNDDPAFNSEFLAEHLSLKLDSKQTILEESNILVRLQLLATILTEENNILKYETELYARVKEQVDQNQRDYYLREQMKIIHEELGDDDIDEEIENYKKAVSTLPIAKEYQEKLSKDIKKLTRMATTSADAAVLRNYLDFIIDLPWSKKTNDNTDVVKAEKKLNKDHYGMEKVKERILEILAIKMRNPDLKGQVICLYGPPGVGKTSIAQSIAKCMNRKFARMSLGGVRDESEIRGHRKTYVGAMAGRVISSIKTAGSMNPVILLDEIDKLGADFRGDPSSALLEVLDTEQNNSFTDHYVEIPFDLSKVLFIATANDLSTIPAPLRDRMEIIDVDSYTREDKFNIAKKHLIPKVLKKYGTKASELSLTPACIYALIDGYTRESGVRKLERVIASVVRKSIKNLVTNDLTKISVKPADLFDILGPVKFKVETKDKKDFVGVVNGLAWTSVGGELLKAEVAVVDGTGKLKLTGSLGDVMKESASIAITYIRSICKKYNIDPSFYTKKDIHIHFPEGAVPKDGPSAGVTITTAVVSALSGIPVKHDVAMTGELSLTGRVLPIGGLKEKSMAAYRYGIKTIIIPKENEPDLYYVDDKVKENVKFIFAENAETVLSNALCLKHLKMARKVRDTNKPNNKKDDFVNTDVMVTKIEPTVEQ